MKEQIPDDRSPLAAAMEWSVRLTTIAFEMALPAGGGYWLDHRVGTLPLFVVLGTMLGFATAMFHLMQIARQKSP